MSHLINNEQKMNDIIFADRNKEYGAYAIRSAYGNTVFKSISFMLIGVGSVMSLAFYLSNQNKPTDDLNDLIVIQDSIYNIPVDLMKKEEKGSETEKKQDASDEKAKPVEGEKAIVIDSTQQITKTSTTSIVAATNTSSTSVETGDGSITGSVTSGGPKKGVDSAEVKESFLVDSGPEFEGGLPALYRFVSSHLKYPAPACTLGEEGTVFVKFVVDENGKVGNLRLLNSVGYGMDDEAIRVVSLIPKFKTPAKVNGKPVKTYYQMPIRFRFKR